MRELKGCNALVTGASRGIGAHIARKLAAEGVNIALLARNGAALEKLAAELSQKGVRAHVIEADLCDVQGYDGWLARLQAQFGAIDVLVNNAGIDAIRDFVEETDQQTEEMLRLDLLAPILLTRRILTGMLARKRGHIVNIASLAGKTATPYCVTYSTAKAGLVAFTHSLRVELRDSGVSASVLCPGFVTGEGMFAQRQSAYGVVVSRLLGTSTPNEVADAVLRALRDDRVEIAINPGPVRMVQALNQLTPDTVAWVQRRMGVNGMLRKIALAARNA